MRRLSQLAAATVLLTSGLALAGVREVELSLPVRPKLALTGQERLYIGPFIREVRGDDVGTTVTFDVPSEFERYLRRLLRKESTMVIVPPVADLQVPTSDPLQLARESAFWREVGSRTGADYVVAGSIEFEVEDRTGYKTEEYTSPVDGRTYYRQVLVEQTGFSYDILINVYDGRTGTLVLEEPLKDFQARPERNFDEFTGMFANLYALENQLIGVFVPRTIKSKRLLFVP